MFRATQEFVERRCTSEHKNQRFGRRQRCVLHPGERYRLVDRLPARHPPISQILACGAVSRVGVTWSCSGWACRGAQNFFGLNNCWTTDGIELLEKNGSSGDSNPRENIYSTTCRATDGTRRTCRV